MASAIYFDSSTEQSGGTLYRQAAGSGNLSFIYKHSQYNEDTDEIKIFETPYASFDQFWQWFTQDAAWYYQHPLFVHPEVRPLVQQALQKADWTIQGDHKWQASHQRQWKKVLTDPGTYYQPYKE